MKIEEANVRPGRPAGGTTTAIRVADEDRRRACAASTYHAE
jgi:hypothetical protein